MYTTRRLSEYQRNPSELTQPPPDGPNSGILVIKDQDTHTRLTCCFTSCLLTEFSLKALPVPQNLKLAARYNDGGDDSTRDPVLFIPVLDKPLSSNLYYAIKRSGKQSGEAPVSGKEEDRVPCCFCLSTVPEPKPKQLDPYDIYQQFEIHQKKPSSSYFYATSVAHDGVPPWFLWKHKWTIEYVRSPEFELRDDAKGLNTELRSKLPELGTNVVVGKWYVPFIFVKDGDAKEQIKKSMYYSMTLEQRWEKVSSYDNFKSRDDDKVDIKVEAEVVKLEGQDITRGVHANGFVWFEVGDKKIGLGSVVVERMKWEVERFGWTSKSHQTISLRRVEKPKDGFSWESDCYYVLIESFVLKRKDESLVLTYDFAHVDKLKSNWE